MVRSSLILSLLLCPFAAHAEQPTRSLGLGPQLMSIVGSEAFMWGVTLEGALSLQDGFELYLRAPLLVVEDPGGSRLVASGATFGVRYFFDEGVLRPWVGLQLGGLLVLTSPGSSLYFGPGVTAGLDWRMTKTLSLGAHGIYEAFADLGRPWRHQLGGTLMISTRF